MKNLLYKELKLSIHSFFFFLPLLLAVLFFIPQWFYTIVFMYLFWITVPQVYSSYLSNEDYNFIAMLPVLRKDIVKSKALALVALELTHIIFAVIFAVINNRLYGIWNFSLDPSYGLFAVGFAMYGIFNISFLPYYFKTGYFFGRPLITGTVTTLIFAAIIEYGVIKYEFMSTLLEGETQTQLISLFVGVLVGIMLTVIAIQISIKRYEKIDR